MDFFSKYIACDLNKFDITIISRVRLYANAL